VIKVKIKQHHTILFYVILGSLKWDLRKKRWKKRTHVFIRSNRFPYFRKLVPFKPSSNLVDWAWEQVEILKQIKSKRGKLNE